MLRNVALALAAMLTSACTTDHDCQLNGVCDAGSAVCQCDAAWGGASCGTLNVGIGSYAYAPPNTTAWGGGPPVYDATKQQYVLYVTEMSNHCGLSVWQRQSHVAKAVAATPHGPYTHEKIVIPTQAHNPCYVQDPPTGTHLIFHIGGGDNPPSPSNVFLNCTNGTTPAPPPPQLQQQHSAAPATMTPSQPYVHFSDSLDGPFERLNITLPPGVVPVGWGYDNPAPFIFDNGTVLMLTRKYNGTKPRVEPHDTIWLVRAPSFRGPFEFVGDGPVFGDEQFNEEDPCIWRDHRGHFHALFHFTRGHAWSPDGLNWSWGGGVAAWTSIIRDATFPGGLRTLKDAERPRVWVNPTTKQPELFFMASGGDQQPTKVGLNQLGFLAVQPIGASAAAAFFEQA